MPREHRSTSNSDTLPDRLPLRMHNSKYLLKLVVAVDGNLQDPCGKCDGQNRCLVVKPLSLLALRWRKRVHTLRLLIIFCQPHTTLSEEHLSQRQWSPPSSSSFAMGTEDTTTMRTTNTTHLSFLIMLPLMLGLASIMSLSASSESSSSSFTSVLTSSNSSFNSSLRSSSFLTPSTAVSADAPGESFVSLT